MDVPTIIKGCQKGQKEAERLLFHHFAPKVLSICRRYSANGLEAKDLMQECFIRVYEKIDTYKFEKGVFEGWLYRVSVNTVLQILRQQKRAVSVLYVEQIPESQEALEEELSENAISQEEIIDAIQQLPLGYRQVFNLYVFEQWSHKEISEELGITESASRSQLTRAKRFLKKILTSKPSSDHATRSIRKTAL